jgi:TAK1-binding protein 1
MQSTLTGVAQAVVDKIVRIHHDVNMSNSQNTLTNGKREDITLLVRNFNFSLSNALRSPTVPSMHLNPQIMSSSNNYTAESSNNYGPWEEDTTSTTDETLTETYDAATLAEKKNARIKPYVDFSEYYTNVEKRKKEGTLPKGIKF